MDNLGNPTGRLGGWANEKDGMVSKMFIPGKLRRVPQKLCLIFFCFVLKYHLKSYLIFGLQKVTGRLDFIQKKRFYD